MERKTQQKHRMTSRNQNDKYDKWILFVAALLPRLIFCMMTVPVRTISDEVATISAAAFLAGNDWSAVVSQAGYYGGGMTAFFFPVFLITDNPVIIYRTMVIGMAVLQALIAPISWYLMRTYFQIKDRVYLAAGALACSFMVVTRATIVYNEHMLIFISWLIAWLLCLLVNAKGEKQKIKYTLLLAGLMIYALTVHIRAVIYMVALVLLVLLYLWTYGSWLISKITAVIAGIGGAVVGLGFIGYLQKHIWKAADGETIRNASLQFATSADFTKAETWQAWCSIVLGQINTITIFTGGLMLLCIVLSVAIFIRSIRRKKEKEPMYMVLLLFFFFCAAMTVAAQSISWLDGTIIGMGEGQTGEYYGLKSITYIRYFGPYTGPLFMAGLCYLSQFHQIRKNMLHVTLCLLLLLQGIWMLGIVPYIRTNIHTTEGLMALACAKRGVADARIYSISMIVLLVVFGIIWFACQKSYLRVVPVLAAVLLLWEYGYDAYEYDVLFAQKYYKRADAGYQLMSEMEDIQEEAADRGYELPIPNIVYVQDATDATDHQIFYLYQMMLNRYQVIPELPPQDCEEAIVFANKKIKQLRKRGYSYAELDENEYVYIKGENLKRLLTECGVELR